mmetsp:Transcript_10297/g.22343  ORF Transcript_10297/g.22343 Transcript_10297/m.22343 type:complete len:216 (+) Transcript_10297:1485-2132(+)
MLERAAKRAVPRRCEGRAQPSQHLCVVCVPLVGVRVSGGQVRVDDAQLAAKQAEPHCHRALVPRRAAEACLHAVRKNVRHCRSRARPHQHEKQQANQLFRHHEDEALAVDSLQRRLHADLALASLAGVFSKKILRIQIDKLLEAERHNLGRFTCARAVEPRSEVGLRRRLAVDVPRACKDADAAVESLGVVHAAAARGGAAARQSPVDAEEGLRR